MLKTTIRTLGDASIFLCDGRIVFPDAETLRFTVLAHLRTRLALLDFAEVKAIDAAGLGILVSLLEWSRTTGTKLKLMNLNPKLEHLLEITHLLHLFEVCSVKDMFELFCGAIQRSQFVEAEAETEGPARVLDDAGQTSIEAQV